ncbi:MAG: J domain-containing protein [Candidatus Aminicenantes bacterium]|jgi:curved DNA-binding protein CbpA
MEHIGYYLRDIHFKKKNGCLVYKQKGLQKYLFFQKGILVMVKTTQPLELLGEILLKLGKISVETFSTIDQYIDPTQSIGKTLIKEGLLTKKDLNDGLMFQMREVTLNIFPLFGGKYEFQVRNDLSKKRFEYKMDVPDLIEEGIRRMDYNPELEKYLKTKIPFYKKTDSLGRLTTEEKELLRTIDGNTSAVKLFHSLGFSPEYYWKSLYLFYCLELVDVKEAKIEGEVPSKEKKPTKPVPPKKKKAKKVSEPAKVIEKKEKVLEEEKEEKVTVEEEKKEPEVLDDETKKKIADLEKLSQQIESMNYYQILNITRDASHKEIKNSYFEMARKYHPDRFDRELPQDSRDLIEEVFGHITRAFQTLNNEKEKQDYDAKLDEPEEVDRKTLEQKADGKFRQGKGLYNRGKYEEALVYFEEAIRIKSNKSNYFLFLAKTESEVPSFNEKAEEDFHKAIEIEPWNAELFVALGEFYNKEGLSVKAKKQFKKALDIDPEHEMARKALGLIETPKKKKGLKGVLSLKKKKKKKT